MITLSLSTYVQSGISADERSWQLARHSVSSAEEEEEEGKSDATVAEIPAPPPPPPPPPPSALGSQEHGPYLSIAREHRCERERERDVGKRREEKCSLAGAKLSPAVTFPKAAALKDPTHQSFRTIKNTRSSIDSVYALARQASSCDSDERLGPSSWYVRFSQSWKKTLVVLAHASYRDQRMPSLGRNVDIINVRTNWNPHCSDIRTPNSSRPTPRPRRDPLPRQCRTIRLSAHPHSTSRIAL